jgi:hypothetical protein
LIIIYHVLARGEPYRDLGEDYFERGNAAAIAKRLARRVEKFGYNVTLTPTDRSIEI